MLLMTLGANLTSVQRWASGLRIPVGECKSQALDDRSTSIYCDRPGCNSDPPLHAVDVLRP